MTNFKLSASLEGHDDDVRAVAFPRPSFVLSASRDKSVRLWTVTKPSPPTYDCTFVSNGSDFVNSVAFVPASPAYPEGLIVAGGRDAIIEVRAPGKLPQDNADALLLGHAGNVCALDVSEDGQNIVSGSWDTEARVWQVGRWDASTELKGHTASVWAVCYYDKETILTGSADRNIHVYHPSGKLIRKLPPAPDVVRALAKLPPSHWSGAQFAAAGNDGVIRLLTLEGHLLGELHGHENFIYSLAVLPTGEIVSAGEDRTVRIWSNGQCIQVITHPAISVWDVAVCKENGDIVTGASDKVVRVFSRSTERQGSPSVITAFEEQVKASAIPQQGLGGINKTDLPGPEFLTSKSGTKEGQVQMIKETNGNVSAYQWSTAANQWVMVGTVVDASGGGSKTTYNGKEYDYVFDVDIKDGEPALKLPYNTTQNPYEAAQKFLNDNELPAAYLDQVANFIITNTQGATIGQQQTNVPGSDPWGQESRYRPGEVGAPTPPTATSRPKVLPQTSYLSITTANLPTILKKAQEFNQQLEADGRKDITFSPSNLAVLTKTTQQLDSLSKNPSASIALTNEGVSMIIHMATDWPAEKRLPGLDLLRLAAASPKVVELTSGEGSQTLIDILASSDNISANAPINNAMMAVRALANLFGHESGRALMDAEFDKVNALVSPFTTSNNRNMSVALTTLYINYSVLIAAGGENHDTDRAITLLDACTRVCMAAVDAEALYRALVGAGTLLCLGSDFRDLAREALDFDKAIERIKGETAGKEPRIKSVIAEILGDSSDK
ncbi:uncharacterized protein PV09_04419 [Verruconis gallopava]|uniref:PUL domain-containing protein n=1 Tax=Verruconis gallopava TaxID=253628 RepID=A0A0D2AZZ1_9PEZI|nr:uncharacterized protein PV09_04419 [Verruconis gallopava]KIW04684.1 hypothetical protein PV09_04419 [Verruconis gallopava]